MGSDQHADFVQEAEDVSLLVLFVDDRVLVLDPSALVLALILVARHESALVLVDYNSRPDRESHNGYHNHSHTDCQIH